MKGTSPIPVILDTNSLLLPFEFKINLEDELTKLIGTFEILVPSTVFDELKKIKTQHAKPALHLAMKYKKLSSKKKGDEAIFDLALKLNAIVVTNDKELRRRLKKKGLKTIYLRQKSYLAMDIP